MPSIQAMAKLTKSNGQVVTESSNILNVDLYVTGGSSNGVSIEFQAGYASASYILAINNSYDYLASDVANLIVDDPNGAVTVVPKTFGSNRYYEIISTGKAGIVTFGNKSNHKSFHIKDNYELPSGTAIKGFKSFGKLHTKIAIEIKQHNFYVPNNISPTIEHIRFTTYPISLGCLKFNDPNIVNWDVSNLKSMENMFYRAESFNQDLSGWCVPQFTSEPRLFADGSILAAANKPVWGTCPIRPLPAFDATLWYSEDSMQGGNFTTYSAGIKDYSPIVYNGTSYADISALFGLSSILAVPSNSPLRALFDQHDKVVFTFKVEGGAQFTVTYNFHTVFSGARQYRNDQYPNLNGYQYKFKPYNKKRAKVIMSLS